MRVTADRDRCIGAGQCVLTLPRVFDQSDDDGRVLVLTEEVADEDLGSVEQAVRLCPMRVLSINGTDHRPDQAIPGRSDQFPAS